MKIIHITNVPFGFRFFHGHIQFLKSNGIEIQLISSPGDELGTLEEVKQREEVKVHAVNMERRISPLNDLVSLWRLWRVLRQVRPDIVHSHTPKAALLGTIAAQASGIKVVLLSIFGVRQMTLAGFSRRLLDFTTWLSCKLADCVWCDSFSIRDYIVKEQICTLNKTVVLRSGSVMGVDAQKTFSPQQWDITERNIVRAENGIPVDAIVIGFVGRIVADKGMRELAAVWRNLRNQYPMLHLMLVGPFDKTDPVSSEDETLFRTDRRVHLTGLRDDVARQLSALDVFVMPSYREGFPVVNLEAAAMGLPVVSTKIPGCVDSVLDGITGTLVIPADSNALRCAIEQYLNDPKLRQKHGLAGRQRVLQKFCPEDIWKSLYQLYIDLIEQKDIAKLREQNVENKTYWTNFKQKIFGIAPHKSIKNFRAKLRQSRITGSQSVRDADNLID